MVRNFFSVLGLVSVFAVFFFFIRPDWMKQISSSPNSPVQGITTKLNARLVSDRLVARESSRENGGFLQIETLPSGEDVSSKIVEDVGDDLPSRNASFVLVLNKSNNSMRYCRLNANVKKVALRGSLPSDVKFQEVTTTPGGPYQVLIWVPAAIDLQLEIEMLIPTPSRY